MRSLWLLVRATADGLDLRGQGGLDGVAMMTDLPDLGHGVRVGL